MANDPLNDGFNKLVGFAATIIAYIATPFVVLFGLLYLIQEFTGLKALDWFLNLLS